MSQEMELADETFYKLIDLVLMDVGRNPLNPSGPHRSIIKVHQADRVLQILAGPGSGKTEMLVWRILYELFIRKTPSQRILVTTFTRKAADDLAIRIVERCDALLEQAKQLGCSLQDPHVHDLRIGTLHSLCDGLLSEFDNDYMSSGTQLIDEHETKVRILRNWRWIFRGAGQRLLDPKDRGVLHALFRAPWDNPQWPTNNLQRTALFYDLVAHQTETWFPRCAASGKPNGLEITHGLANLTEDLIKLQQRWEEYLDSHNILDYTTIQKRFFERQNLIFSEIDHVFVDEFQDTNPIQFAIHTNWLSQANIRLTVVGDDDQSVYRFRGSDIQCFIGLEAECQNRGIQYRCEKLEENMRSTKTIVGFSQAFRAATVLRDVSMPKEIFPSPSSDVGRPVRLLQGPFRNLAKYCAEEVLPIYNAPRQDRPSVAFIMFSASEKSEDSAASCITKAMTELGIRVYNSRNKTAARKGSPVHTLFGLLAYLVDPVVKAPLGRNGRDVEVWATCSRYPGAQDYARSVPPNFRISDKYAEIEKQVLKYDRGTIGNPAPSIRPLVEYIDDIRERLANAYRSGQEPRLTLSGLVARLLSFPYFRNVGFSQKLIREALFTSLLEANIAPTRLSRNSLDAPLEVRTNEKGQYVWGSEYWNLLNIMGTLLAGVDLDDPEFEVFSEEAVQVLTFHQSKGLEFDHVYVCLTGRQVALNNVLQTMLFSGECPRFNISDLGEIESRDPNVIRLATADREREIYVAMTRAKKTLTILYDPEDDGPFSSLNEGLQCIFSKSPVHVVRGWPELIERRYTI